MARTKAHFPATTNLSEPESDDLVSLYLHVLPGGGYGYEATFRVADINGAPVDAIPPLVIRGRLASLALPAGLVAKAVAQAQAQGMTAGDPA